MPDIDIVRRSAGGTGPWKTEPESAGGGSQPATWIEVTVAGTFDDSVVDPAAGGLPVLDGYQTVSGDRVLLWNDVGGGSQPAATQGVWVASAGSWARADDVPEGRDIANLYITTGGVGALYDEFAFRVSGPTAVVGTDAVFLQVAFVNSMLVVPYPGGYLSNVVLGLAIDANSARIYNPVIVLPTSDPAVVGALWNNMGTPAISNGP